MMKMKLTSESVAAVMGEVSWPWLHEKRGTQHTLRLFDQTSDSLFSVSRATLKQTYRIQGMQLFISLL